MKFLEQGNVVNSTIVQTVAQGILLVMGYLSMMAISVKLSNT